MFQKPALGPRASSPSACVIRLHGPETLLSTSQLADITLSPRSSCPGRGGAWPCPPPFEHVPHARRVTLARPAHPASALPTRALGDIERQRRGRRGVLCVGGAGGHGEPPRPAPGGWWDAGLRAAGGCITGGVSYLLQPWEDRSG